MLSVLSGRQCRVGCEPPMQQPSRMQRLGSRTMSRSTPKSQSFAACNAASRAAVGGNSWLASRPPQLHHHASAATSRCVVARGVVPVAERNGWWLKHPQPNLISAKGVGELMDILSDNKDKLVLVEFFAPWCASCKGLYPKLSKLCAENPQILVVKMNFEENRTIARKLGIKVLPFFHAYHGSMGRVAAFSASVTKVQRLKDCIRLFGMPYCDVQTHNSALDVSKSLPEFMKMPTPEDASVLKFDSDGEYSQEKSIEAKMQAAIAAKKASESGREAAESGSEAEPAAAMS